MPVWTTTCYNCFPLSESCPWQMGNFTKVKTDELHFVCKNDSNRVRDCMQQLWESTCKVGGLWASMVRKVFLHWWGRPLCGATAGGWRGKVSGAQSRCWLIYGGAQLWSSTCSLSMWDLSLQELTWKRHQAVKHTRMVVNHHHAKSLSRCIW